MEAFIDGGNWSTRNPPLWTDDSITPSRTDQMWSALGLKQNVYLIILKVTYLKGQCHTSRSMFEIDNFFVRPITFLFLDQFSNYLEVMLRVIRRCVASMTQVPTSKLKATHQDQSLKLTIPCPAYNFTIPWPIFELFCSYVQFYRAVCRAHDPGSYLKGQGHSLWSKLENWQFLVRLITFLFLDNLTYYLGISISSISWCVVCINQIYMSKVKVTYKGQSFANCLYLSGKLLSYSLTD
jgi:hypothetical protein